jgi:uncharacterized membrane protein
MENTKETNEEKNESQLVGLVEKNITALVNRQIKEEREKPFEERIAERIGRFTGNLAFIYTHAIIFGIWIIWNVGWLGLKPFDPDFNWLQIVTQVEAIFLTTFILMSQNSLDAQADKRADLDLQVSLLSEHEITRLITMVKGIAQKLEIEEAKDPEIDELSKEVVPEKLLDKLETEKQKSIKDAGIGSGKL